jgi:hypothetical protein
MPDRADYLARILIARMRSLEEALADRSQADVATDTRRRVELVEKVMAIEAGVVDGSTHRLLLAAMPTVTPGTPVGDRDLREFTSFVRRHLPADA